jgi:hypothetical protein
MIIDASFNPTPCFLPTLVYLLGEPTSLLGVANTHPPLSLICQQLPHPLLALLPFHTPQFRLHYLHRHQQLQSSSSGTRSLSSDSSCGIYSTCLLFWISDIELIRHRQILYRNSQSSIWHQGSVQYRNDPISERKAQHRISDIGDITSNINAHLCVEALSRRNCVRSVFYAWALFLS